MIIKALEKLQKAVKVCSDELESEIVQLRKTIEASNANLKRKLIDLEKKMKSIGCVNNGKELLRAIFTLGLACLFDNDTKKEMLNVKADLREEQAIIQAIGKRMNYFDDLLGSAKTLVKESAAVINTTKTFRQALVVAKTILTRDYTPEDIAENLGDVDFANDFAEELYKTLHELKKSAEHVANDCIQRKHNLDAALSGINKYFGEEEQEIIELTATSNDAKLG
jgi:archaellum component FlaC